MGANTKINWCRHTFNPWLGCQGVSPACDNCFAEEWAKRYGAVEWGAHAERKRTSAQNWNNPLKWDRAAAAAGERHRVFAGSLCDVFDNRVPPAWRRDLFDLIRETPSLDWLLLTKRPQNIERLYGEAMFDPPDGGSGYPWPANAAMGTTVEDQLRADQRVPALLKAAAALRPLYTFLSCEPLLGPLDLGKAHALPIYWEGMEAIELRSWGHHIGFRQGDGWRKHSGNMQPWVDWVICGGESGSRARPMNPQHVRSLRDQCDAAGVPFLFKQWGEYIEVDAMVRGTPHWQFADGGALMRRVGKDAAGRLLDGVLHDAFPSIAPSIDDIEHTCNAFA